MTERTIRSIAKELAGQFYEFTRAAESKDQRVQLEERGRVFLDIDPKLFAKSYPTLADYLAGRRHGRMQRNWITGKVWHVDDGRVYADKPGWVLWYDKARKCAVEMLNKPEVHENLKSAIMDALIEDREKQLKNETSQVHNPGRGFSLDSSVLGSAGAKTRTP